MADLSTLQAQLASLKAARASGATRLSYEGKSIEYRSDADMQAAISAVQSEIDALNGKSKPRILVTRSSKGW